MTRLFIVLGLLFQAPMLFGDHHVTYQTSPETKQANLPFSDAVRINDMIYLSGQIGAPPGSVKVVAGGIDAETHQIFANMKLVLEAGGSSIEDIVKCTVMMGDMAQWSTFNEVYVTYFPDNKPARSAFGANGLALGASVELECWVVANGH